MQQADVLSYWMTPGFLASLRDPLSKGIAVAGRGDEYHTGMFAREGADLVALGMRLGTSKLRLLDDEVARTPGRIDVYRYFGRTQITGGDAVNNWVLGATVRGKLVDEMRRLALHDRYGWREVLASSGYFVPFVRWLVRPHSDQIADLSRAPFCSMAVSFVFRKWARALLNKRTDGQMLPGDIVTSPYLSYLFTLTTPVNTPQPIGFYFERAGVNQRTKQPTAGSA